MLPKWASRKPEALSEMRGESTGEITRGCLNIWILKIKVGLISVNLCEFPTKNLTLVAVYGFGADPKLLLSNFTM